MLVSLYSTANIVGGASWIVINGVATNGSQAFTVGGLSSFSGVVPPGGTYFVGENAVNAVTIIVWSETR